MDFSDPFTGMGRPKLTDAQLAQAIRIDMAAELDAINLYQSHLESTDNPVAQRMIRHIMEEEKDHLEEFAQLLYTLDPRQVESLADAQRDFVTVAGGQPTGIAPDADAAPAPATPAAFTVGSLKDAG